MGDNEKEDSNSDNVKEAEIEDHPEEVMETESPLASSADGINDLIVDVNASSKPQEITQDKENEKDDSIDTSQNKDLGVTIRLDQLDEDMTPVDSVQIEEIEADGVTEDTLKDLNIVEVPMSDTIAVVVTEDSSALKPKLNIDKNKLFSQMNDIFAKDTHQALKNRPVYPKKPTTSAPSPVTSPTKEVTKEEVKKVNKKKQKKKGKKKT